MRDRLGVAESLVGAASVVASADPSIAAALLSEAERIRGDCAAVATPRQAADVAAVRALLGGHEQVPEEEAVLAEGVAVDRALSALAQIEHSTAARAD
jgi:hypothetical protein